MDEHPAPPRRRLLPLRTTADIFKQTASIFSTRKNLILFLFLSDLLVFHRVNVEMATDTLTSNIDNEPSIKSHISQIHGPPNSTSPTTRRRLPHRVGTLDDDLDHGFFDNLPKPQSNSTSLIILNSFDPQFGFFNSVSGDGIAASETVRSSAKTTFRSTDIIEYKENAVTDEIKDSLPINETAESKSDSHDFTSVLYPLGSFTAWHAYVIFTFVATQSIVHGVIFILVLNHFCRRPNSFVMTYVSGSLFGFIRSCRFFTIRWIFRLWFTVFLTPWFFGEIEDPFSLLKIFVRLMFLPFSIFTPWDIEFEKEIVSFIIAWLIFDFLLSLALTVDVWVVMADPRQINEREVVKEGFRLLLLMIKPAIELKCYESLVCGPYARWLIAQRFGEVADLFATALQAFMEVYFMVAWMVYYLSLKSIDANLKGQRFGQRELKAMLKDVNDS